MVGRHQKEELRQSTFARESSGPRESAAPIGHRVYDHYQFESSLAKQLVEDWAGGFCSASSVQKICCAALVDVRHVLLKSSSANRDDLLPRDLVGLSAMVLLADMPVAVIEI